MADNDNIRKAVVSLIERGLATHAEAAKLAGKSRQCARFWATEAGITTEAREERLRQEWQKALERAEKSS
jgi:predicted HTH domain antitoxin